MPRAQIDKTITALAGEFLVAGQLCMRGYLASLTLKNYPKVDIFVLNPKNGKQTTLQIKTLRRSVKRDRYGRNDSYLLPEDLTTSAPYFVFVYIISQEEAEFFIIPASKVEDISSSLRNVYLKSHPKAARKQTRWLSITAIKDEYKDNWGALGLE